MKHLNINQRDTLRRLIKLHPDSVKILAPTSLDLYADADLEQACHLLHIDMGSGIALADAKATRDAETATDNVRDMPLETMRRIAQELIDEAIAPVARVVTVIERADGRTSSTGDAILHREYATLLECAMVRDSKGFSPNIMLVGPAATGKTTAAIMLASQLGRELIYNPPLIENTDTEGYRTPDGAYISAPFAATFDKPVVFLFDEFDASLASGTMPLQGPLSINTMTRPDGKVITRHKDHLVLAATNTYGRGATMEHAARNAQDGATLSRFTDMITFDYDLDMETLLVERQFPEAIAGAWRWECQQVRAHAIERGFVVADLRTMLRGAARLVAGHHIEKVRATTYLAGLDDDQTRQLLAVARKANR